MTRRGGRCDCGSNALGDEATALAWLRERTGVDPEGGLLVITPRVPWRRRLTPRLPGQSLAEFGVLAEVSDWMRLARSGPLAFSPWRLVS